MCSSIGKSNKALGGIARLDQKQPEPEILGPGKRASALKITSYLDLPEHRAACQIRLHIRMTPKLNQHIKNLSSPIIKPLPPLPFRFHCLTFPQLRHPGGGTGDFRDMPVASVGRLGTLVLPSSSSFPQSEPFFHLSLFTFGSCLQGGVRGSGGGHMALWNADNLATPELSTLGGLGDLPRQPIRHSNGPSSLPRTSYTSARGSGC